MRSEGLQRRWQPTGPLDLAATLAPHRRGGGDPAYRIAGDGAIWRAVHTPDGPGTLRLAAGDPVDARAWGPGAGWLIEQLPEMLGAADDLGLLATISDARVAELLRRGSGFRLGRSGRVWEALAAGVLEQKVVGTEAWRAWRYLLRRYGDPAPGPTPEPMRVPPPPAVWREIPVWEWHRAGVEAVRGRTIRNASAVEVERHVDRLAVLRGIGHWTEAEVRQRALGDPDAVSVGDFHVARVVGQTLVGEPVDDDTMLELLEPFAGQRGRVALLCMRHGDWPTRRGPRLAPRDYRRF